MVHLKMRRASVRTEKTAPVHSYLRYAGPALAALAALTYAETLAFEFVWDDILSVNGWLPSLKTWWSPFFPLEIPSYPYSYYRPFQLISYWIDNLTGGGAPWTFHLTTVTFHVAATYLVFRTGLLLFGGYPAAWQTAAWAGVLFAVHPIHSESVAWMGARPDPMVTCFGLSALLAYQHSDWNPARRSWIAAGLIFLALLSKENAIALLVLVPASTWALQSGIAPAKAKRQNRTCRSRRDDWMAILPFGVVAILYLVLRSIAMHAAALPRMPDEPLRTVVGALGTYLRLLVVPYPHNAFIAEVPTDSAVIGGGAAILVLYGALVWRLWRSGDRRLVFALGWILVVLAPSFAVINMYPTAPLAERYLYLPSVGFCWAFGAAVAYAGERGRRWRLATQAAATALIAIALIATIDRNRDWRDDYVSWRDAAEKNPVDGLPMRHYAEAVRRRGKFIEAQRLYERALGLRNDQAGRQLIHGKLGLLTDHLGDYAAAERHYRKALEISSTPEALFNLALFQLKQAIDSNSRLDRDRRGAKLSEARSLLEQALALTPRDPDIYIGLAHVAEASGDAIEARRRFAQALRHDLPAERAAAVRSRMYDAN